MKFFSLIYQGDIHPATDKKVIPKEEFGVLVSAQEVLEKTIQDAEELKKKTHADCEILKKEAQEEGFKEGLSLFNEHALYFEKELKKIRHEMQQTLLPLVLQASKKVVAAQLDLKPETIVDIVLATLAPVTQNQRITIYVNKEDKEILEKEKPRLKEILEQLETLKIKERNDIARGGCVIETETGIINATLENQWRSIEAAFEKYMNKNSFFFGFFLTLFFVAGSGLFAAEPPDVTPPSVLTDLAVLAGLALLPYAVMLLTSYVKIVIVLSLTRNALGVQQSPPNQVINGIALLMTLYVMFPVATKMYSNSKDFIHANPPTELISGVTANYIIGVADRAKEPLREFLENNTISKHMTSFYQLAYKSMPDEFKQTLKPNDFIVLIPAFITSQLKTAFEIGVLIYLPFFVIDLVTSNILLAMGMMMLSPLTIALPLKLLLLVMVDGWTLIIQGLVLTFR